jgi:uncharacterized membrane protein YfcA
MVAMRYSIVMNAWEIAGLVGASAGGGLMNAMAGGGTILTFPALVLMGQPAIAANATSTVALLPGSAAAIAGYGKEVASHREWLKTLLLPSLLGGAIGAILLLLTSEHVFARLAPILVLFATLLFLVQGVQARRRRQTDPPDADADRIPLPLGGRFVSAWLLQFAIAIYGGYFGAAIGILMLSVLGFMGLRNIFAMNGLKNFFNLCINCVAAGYFILRGAVVWPLALIMMAGATAGGYGGARLALRIGKERARAAVVVIGFAVTALLFWQQWRS